MIPVANKEEIVMRLREVRSQITSLGVNSIGLFGSFATEKQTPSSDVDFLVEFGADQHTFDNFMNLSFLLESVLGRKVELVTPESLSPHIGPYILREVKRVPFAA